MNTRLQFLITLITTIGLASCASYKTQYRATEKNWQAVALPNKPLAHQVFLIGDAGGGDENHPKNTLQLLGKQLEKANQNSSIIFLGDNSYPHGLPKKGTDTLTNGVGQLLKKVNKPFINQFPETVTKLMLNSMALPTL